MLNTTWAHGDLSHQASRESREGFANRIRHHITAGSSATHSTCSYAQWFCLPPRTARRIVTLANLNVRQTGSTEPPVQEQTAHYRPSNSNPEAMTQHLKYSRRASARRAPRRKENAERTPCAIAAALSQEKAASSQGRTRGDGSPHRPHRPAAAGPQRRAAGTRGAERNRSADRPAPTAPQRRSHPRGAHTKAPALRPAPRTMAFTWSAQTSAVPTQGSGAANGRREKTKGSREPLRPRTKGRGSGPGRPRDPSAGPEGQRAAAPGPARPRAAAAERQKMATSPRRGAGGPHKGSLCAGPAPRRRPRPGRTEPGRHPPSLGRPPGAGNAAAGPSAPPVQRRSPPRPAARAARRLLSTAPLRPPSAARL